jgi:hypothetical protein
MVEKPKNLSDVRRMALKRAKYRCEWAECKQSEYLKLTLLQTIGYQGYDSIARYDLDNCAMFCETHDAIYNGKNIAGRKMAFGKLVKAYLDQKRK